jgi:hypothetical protein
MKAYVIALESVHDQAMFGEYAKGVAAPRSSRSRAGSWRAVAATPCSKVSGNTRAP